MAGREQPPAEPARAALMLTYMLDTNICIYVMKNYPLELQEKFNSLAEQLCISCITLGELHYGAEKSARRRREPDRHRAFHGASRRAGLRGKAAAHYGQVGRSWS